MRGGRGGSFVWLCFLFLLCFVLGLLFVGWSVGLVGRCWVGCLLSFLSVGRLGLVGRSVGGWSGRVLFVFFLF